MSSEKGINTLHSRALMPVTQQDGRALWQGSPPPAACVFSPASPLSVELTVRGVPTQWEECCGGVARVGKIEVNGFKHGKDWKGAVLHRQNGQTDRCGKNRKGFQVKELWRWEIRSLHPRQCVRGWQVEVWQNLVMIPLLFMCHATVMKEQTFTVETASCLFHKSEKWKFGWVIWWSS